MRAWPAVVSFTLGIVPVLMLGFMVASILLRSQEALTDVGIAELFSTRFSSIFTSGRGNYGLLPSLWASFLILVMALAFALPVSLAFGIFSSEFPLGPLGRLIRVMLAVFAGIPPIVYALLAVVFVAPFIAPKFTANFTYNTADPSRLGLRPDQFPPEGLPWNPGALPWDPTGGTNSLLLAGILLGLLVIPFMAPLVDDAIRNVPRDPKDASLALGADRWFTLTHITLPRALPGIVAATGLGALKVLGDVMIVLFVVGWDASQLPSPALDVFERTAPLTATGAGLAGGFYGPRACEQPDCGVGYFTALLLLILAIGVILVTWGLERRLRRRYGE